MAFGSLRGVAAAMLAAGAMLLGGCGSSETMRYKMVVEVDTPEGLKTGHAVREIRYYRPANVPSIGESRPQWGVRGEAVAVDLPGGQTLFALLRSDKGSSDLAGYGVWAIFEQTGKDEVELWPSPPPTTAPRIRDPWPMLVRFNDTTNSESVQLVDPNNLATHFGNGYALRRVFVQKTDEKISYGITKRLPWINTGTDRRLKFDHSPRDSSVAARTRHRDFIREGF